MTIQKRANLSLCVGIAALGWMAYSLFNIADVFLHIWHRFCVGSVMDCSSSAVLIGGPLTVVGTSAAVFGPTLIGCLLMDWLYPTGQLKKDRAANERGEPLEP